MTAAVVTGAVLFANLMSCLGNLPHTYHGSAIVLSLAAHLGLAVVGGCAGTSPGPGLGLGLAALLHLRASPSAPRMRWLTRVLTRDPGLQTILF